MAQLIARDDRVERLTLSRLHSLWDLDKSGWLRVAREVFVFVLGSMAATPLGAAAEAALKSALQREHGGIGLGLYFIGEHKVFHEILQPLFHMKC